MNNTINGRTPEEIKKGLECCNTIYGCKQCPYDAGDEDLSCCVKRNADVLALINQLLEDKKQLERERDAAVEDMTELMKGSESCTFCKHYVEDGDYCAKPPTSIFSNGMCWQWRGAQEEVKPDE